jgi:member of the syntaxin family of t-SNAREs
MRELTTTRDVLTQIASVRPLFNSYLRIRSLTTDANSPELASARSDLETALSSLAEDLADLVQSVQAVENDPSQFGLTAHEVTRRKRLVQEVGGEIEDMREELARKLDVRSGVASNGAAGKSDLPDPNSFAIPDGEGADDGAYAEFAQHQQMEMMREQDQHLDGVFQTVGNLRRQADDMGRELEEQGEMLNIVDDLADRVGGRLQTGMQKLNHVIRRNEDRYSTCCIGLLILVLFILLILVIAL